MLAKYRQSFFRGVLWRNADFQRLWWGESISQVGSQISMLALPLLAISQLDASPAEIGILNAAQLAPFVLVGSAAGVWLDRNSRRRAMITMNFARAALVVAVPVLAYTHTLKLWDLYVIGFLAGCMTVVFEIAFVSYLPSLVDREQLSDANAKMSLTYSTTQAAGPGIAGILIQLVTAKVAIIVDAATYLAAGSTVAGIRRPEPAREPTKSTRWQDFLEGLRIALGHRMLRSIALMSAWFNFFEQIILTIFPVYAVRSLDFTPGEIGLVIALGGVGATGGSLVARRVADRFGAGAALASGVVLSAVALASIPLAPSPRPLTLAVLMTGFTCYGAGLAVYNVHVSTLRQSLVPDGALGRVSASYRTLSWGTLPLGALCGGWAGGALGLRATAATAVAVLVAGCVLLASSSISRVRTWEEPSVQAVT